MNADYVALAAFLMGIAISIAVWSARFAGHLIAGSVGARLEDQVHAKCAPLLRGVPPRGGPFAQVERPVDLGASEGARCLAAVA